MIPAQVSHFCHIQSDMSVQAPSAPLSPWLGNQGESPTLPPVSVLVRSPSDADEVSANGRRRRRRQRRLQLRRPVNGGRTERPVRSVHHPYKPSQPALTWRGKSQISQENGRWSPQKTLRNFWKCWVSNACRDNRLDWSNFIQKCKKSKILVKTSVYDEWFALIM